jgi:S-adenosylmethionine:tRNA ribosyltransferase-isomerase
VNDSRVIPARLLPKRAGGGHAEVLLVHREAEGTWIALVRPGQRIHAGTVLTLEGGDGVEVLAHLPTGERRVRLVGDGDDDGVLARHGHVPLPPYIHRADTAVDRERYQTVYAREPGSVAAPTAGLHFTPDLLERLAGAGVASAELILHVGPGTFRPLRPEDLAAGRLHAERFELPAGSAQAVAAARARSGRVVAVGTTSCRVLEHCAAEDGAVRAARGETELLIAPGHRFRAVDVLLTNFHLPRSSLLLLVAAFAGREAVLGAYAEAVELGYRFYSYGDAMLIL